MTKLSALPTRLERIAALVREPSVSCMDPAFDQGNQGVLDVYADWLDALGFRVQLVPVPGATADAANAANPANAANAVGGKASLIATLGEGEGGLVLAGHTDTVPYNAELWASDPFEVEERDGRLYGLGTTDMKAFLALAVEAAVGLQADSLRAPLMIVATADEESTMAGARSLQSLGEPFGRHAIIGEPSDMRPIRAHKGAMMESFTVLGRSGHSSDPSLGNNALEGMHRVISALLRYRQDELEPLRNDAFAVPSPTMNFGAIRGGDNPNRICGRCELHLDVRLLPGMQVEEVRARLVGVAREALAGSGLELEHRPLFGGAPSYEAAVDADIVRAAEALTGQGSVTAAFATEAPYFAALGAQSVILGPGGIAQAHQPDEFVRVDHLEPTVQALHQFVHRFCVAPT